MEKESKQPDVNTPVSFDEFPVPGYDEWKQAVEKALKGAPFDKKMYTSTYEGITLSPIYTMDDVKNLKDPLTFPGSGDYLRGTNSCEEKWGIAQGIEGDCCPSCASAEMATELEKGATVIHPVLDPSTLRGEDTPTTADSEHGVSLFGAVSADKIFSSVDPTAHEVHVACGPTAVPVLGLIADWAKRNGKKVADIKGCVGADPIAALARDGKLSRSLAKFYDEMAATIRWADANASTLRTILLRGSVYSEAGASAVQETACILAEAAAIIRAMADRGIDPSDTMKRIRVEVSLGANFFMEIARLRALRVLWAHMGKAFGAEGDALKANVIAENSRFTMTVYDPYVNILRAATQTFSGVVGGVDAMSIHPFDSAVRTPTEQARRIARNQQIMLQTEFNFDATADPAGGSWYVETLTRQVEDKTWQLFQKIEGEGGIVAAIKNGVVAGEINAVLTERFKKLATRADRAVGNNMYANMTEKPLETVDEGLEAFIKQREPKVVALKADRDAKAADAALAAVKDGATNLVDAAAGAFAAGAALSDVWAALNAGSAAEEGAAPLTPHRWTEQYEALRKRTEDYIAKTGDNVKIFLANMGPIPQHKARADFSTGFFEVAHFEILKNNGFATVEEAADAAAASGADAAVICSTDATYPELVPALARLIKGKCPGITLFLAGAPAKEFKQSYIDAGVDEFIHVKANCLQILTAMQNKKGMC